TTRQVIDQVVWILGGMSDTLVDDEGRPAFRKFVTARLAKRKNALGWAPKSNAPNARTAATAATDDALVRPTLLLAMGNLAEDETTLKEAEEQATRWLADPTGADADTAGVALDLASRRAGEQRLTALRAAAKSAKTREDRILALRAMMGFDDPTNLAHAL